MTVVGTPDAKSTLACVGSTTPGAFGRVKEVADCVITIKDAGEKATTGLRLALKIPMSRGGVLKGLLASQNSNYRGQILGHTRGGSFGHVFSEGLAQGWHQS